MRFNMTSVVLAAALLLGGVSAQAATTYRLANTGNPTDDYTYGCEEFAKELEKISNGEMKVIVSNNGVLGNDRVTTEMTQQGSLDFSLVGQSQFNGFIKDLAALDVPYMVDASKNDQFMKTFGDHNSDLYKYLDAEAAKAGLKIVMVLDSPFRSYAFSPKSNVTDLASAKGVKVRVTMSPMERDFVNAAGMNPTPMGWPDVYPALQQGTVDGELVSPGTFASAKRNEVEDRFLMTRHNMAKLFVVMNLAKFNALTPEQQKWVMEAGAIAQEKEWAKTKEYDEIGNAFLKENNIKVMELTPEEMTQLQKNLEPVMAERTKDINPKFIELLKAAQN